MTFRSRLLIAFALATIIPLALLGLGVRRQLTTRLVAQHRQRVEGMARVAAQDVERESASIAARLATLARALRTDDRFRTAAVRGDPGERAYLLDWAEQAMRTTGLDMLQVQDSAGRILSSGHFRNEFDRLEPELPRALGAAKSAVLVPVRAPEGRSCSRESIRFRSRIAASVWWAGSGGQHSAALRAGGGQSVILSKPSSRAKRGSRSSR